MKNIVGNKEIRILRVSIALACLIFVGIIMQSCNSDDLLGETLDEKPEFPFYADNYGKNVAKGFRNTVENLNRMGVDYSKADTSTAFKEEFYKNIGKINPEFEDNIQPIDPAVFAEKVRSLTDIQIEFIQRIIEECNQSNSYQNLLDRLTAVNKDIYSRVPEIEQDRLFNITAVLYYGIKEIQNLEKQGQMLITPHNDIQRVRLKSGSESGGSVGGSCHKFLATVWVIAIGEPTPAGEIVAAIVTVGALLYEITVCQNSTQTIDCSDRYAKCVTRGLLPSWKCYDCFVYCQGQNVWECPRPY
jgi:hypothetical protein